MMIKTEPVKPARLATRVIWADSKPFELKQVQLIPRRTTELLFLFFADFQTQMIAKGRKGPARWALKQKSKYFKLLKGGENK